MPTDRLSLVRYSLVGGGQTFSYTGTAGNTTQYAPGPDAVWCWATTDCYVKIGDTVTATTTDFPIPAYTPVVIPVPTSSGKPFRVSAVQISAGGNFYCCPVT